MAKPLFIIMSGCNGSGKSTAATLLIPDDTIYLNADEMAKALPGYPSQSADMQASRMMLSQMDDLESSRADFAVETTLASRSLAPRAVRLRQSGYEFRLIFAFLPDAELAITRVAGRVRHGGHHIPEDTIRRRYLAGISNFFNLYQPLADGWSIYNTVEPYPLKLIANGRMGEVDHVEDLASWDLMRKKVEHV